MFPTGLPRFPPSCALLCKKHPHPTWNKGTVMAFSCCTLCGAGLGDIDLELVFSQSIVVEHADCLVSVFLRGHGYESEALRLAGALVHGDFDRRDGSCGCEQGIDFILCGRLVQISYVNSYFHFVLLSTRKGIVRHCRNKNGRRPYKRVGGQGVRQRSYYSYVFSVAQLSPTGG